ncbi:MAG: hypothetical protein CL843_09120 [Crocinitomicaceae bacterium]|nr:hypothetical protein [Crocinitomicaceae bacterium]|tara:strand:+ start:1276 stop:1560 length:285 start_codon:yes stop_codon:yes gene_type:complete
MESSKLIVITPDQLKNIINECIESHANTSNVKSEEIVTYGYSDLQRIFSCSERHAKGFRNKIPFVKDGKKVLFLRKDVEAYLKNNTVNLQSHNS